MRRTTSRPTTGIQPTVLKPQDIAIALKILVIENRLINCDSSENGGSLVPHDFDPILQPKPWTLTQLARETHISLGEVHNSLRRLTIARLLRLEGRSLHRHGLEEFLIHGVRYAFPSEQGAVTRGFPTSYTAPMLRQLFLMSGQEMLVWPHPNGTARGATILPLYAAATEAALEDDQFYELLALVDCLRGDSRARERAAAQQTLQNRIENTSFQMPAVTIEHPMRFTD